MYVVLVIKLARPAGTELLDLQVVIYRYKNEKLAGSS
jgi:hypothetical protein